MEKNQRTKKRSFFERAFVVCLFFVILILILPLFRTTYDINDSDISVVNIVNKEEKNNKNYPSRIISQSILDLEVVKQIEEVYNEYKNFEEENKNLLREQINPKEFKLFSFQARYHRELSLFLQSLSSLSPSINDNYHHQIEYLSNLRDEIDVKLYRFLNQKSWKFKEEMNYKGRGIVIGVGPKYVKFAFHLILSLREIHHCYLPIEIFCIHQNELSKEEKQLFSRFDNITIKYIDEMINNEYAKVQSYAVKPFAILLSSFEEVILVDADVVFLSNPELLFDDPDYLQSKAFFYYDRTQIEQLPKQTNFLEEIIADLRDEIKATPMYRGYSHHLCEAGVLVYHKRIHFHSLLLTCKLNCDKEREEVLWKETHGEKEAYWLAMEMIADYQYKFNQFPASIIGHKNAKVDRNGKILLENRICGNLMHLNYFGKPFWINGGLLQDKNSNNVKLSSFSYWSMEDQNIEINQWENEKQCLISSQIFPLNQSEIEMINSLLSFWSLLP